MNFIQRSIASLLLFIWVSGTAFAATTTIQIQSGAGLSNDFVTVAAGDTVVWTNQDATDVTLFGAEFTATITSGSSFSHTYNFVGTFGYTVAESGDTGTVEVTAVAAAPTPTLDTCPDGTTTNYPQCLFNIQGDEELLPTDPSYLPDIRFTAEDSQISGRTLIKLITRFVLGFVGAIAMLMLIIGGYMYITARGDEGQTEKAKNTIVGAVIGIIVILAAWTIVITVLNISERGGGNQFIRANEPTPIHTIHDITV